MTAISELLPFILPFVRDCSQPAALVAARWACIEFCKMTLWQQEMLEPVDLRAGQSFYEIEVPPNTVPTRVMRIETSTRLLLPKTKDELDILCGRGWTSQQGTPKYYTQFSTRDVVLVPTPDVDLPGEMCLLVAVQPTPDAVEIDDSLFEHYAEPLAYGARARLVETAGQPYYDPTSAPLLWGRFYGAVSEAKGRRMTEHTRTVQYVQMRPFV